MGPMAFKPFRVASMDISTMNSDILVPLCRKQLAMVPVVVVLLVVKAVFRGIW